MSWQDEVCREVQEWIGTPYIPKGRVKGVGADCGGLLYEIYNPHFGPFKTFPATEYSADWAMHTNKEMYLDFVMPYVKEVATPVFGGFSLFHIGLVYAHAAIYIGKDFYVHAWGRTDRGSVTKTAGRVMRHMGKGFPIRHFAPIE